MRHSHSKSTHNCGYGTLIAITMMTIVSMVLTVSVLSFGQAGRRTIHTLADVQLRQLLLAGTAHTRDNIQGWKIHDGPQTWDVKLPDRLREHGGTVKLKMILPNDYGLEFDVLVIASLDERQARQTLHYVKTTFGWELASARIGDTTQAK